MKEVIVHTAHKPMTVLYSDELKTNGYVILKNLIPADTFQKVAQDIDNIFTDTPYCKGLFYGEKTKRFGALFSRTTLSHQLAVHPIILAIMDKILKPFCQHYQISLTQGIKIFPGETGQPPHRDDEMFPWPHPGTDWMVNCMWALSDFTEENGATMLWPRSNLDPLTRFPNPEHKIVAKMEKGDCLLYLGSTFHGGGPNTTTDQTRTGLVISYNLGWLRQTECQYLVYPPEVVKTFPTELIRLLGYRTHRPNLGWTHGIEPIEWLENIHQNNVATKDLLTNELNEEIKAYYGVENHSNG